MKWLVALIGFVGSIVQVQSAAACETQQLQITEAEARALSSTLSKATIVAEAVDLQNDDLSSLQIKIDALQTLLNEAKLKSQMRHGPDTEDF